MAKTEEITEQHPTHEAFEIVTNKDGSTTSTWKLPDGTRTQWTQDAKGVWAKVY